MGIFFNLLAELGGISEIAGGDIGGHIGAFGMAARIQRAGALHQSCEQVITRADLTAEIVFLLGTNI